MKGWWPAVLAVLALLVAGVIVYTYKNRSAGNLSAVPTPTPAAAAQLSPDKQPKVELTFTSDSHYATVSFTNLYADAIEYNLIYDATVGKNALNTGVNSTATVTGKTTFSQKQLLGSESSGHFSYHTNIHNASMELTLRDAQGRSIFTATYPFTVSAGATVSLTPTSE